MPRLNEDQKLELVKMIADGDPAKEVADYFGVSVSTVHNIVNKAAEDRDLTETPEEEEEEDLEYWKAWAIFWKDKYLDEHGKLVELESAEK